MSEAGQTGEPLFEVLGPVRVLAGGRAGSLGPGKQACLAALLLLNVGRAVPADTVIERIWGDRPPARASGAVATYAARLRRLLNVAGGRPAAALRYADGGYVIECDPQRVDIHRARRLAAQARDVAAADDAWAAQQLRAALRGWQPVALAGVPGAWATGTRAALLRERLFLLAALARAELRLGRAEQVAAELAAVVDEHPAEEDLAAELMNALVQCGRSVEALGRYERLRRAVADAYGAEPSARLRELHLAILRSPPPPPGPPPPAPAGRPATPVRATTGPVAAPAGPPAPPAVLPAAGQAVPAQLPADAAAFTGRVDELRRLDRQLCAGRSGGTALPVMVITGTPGVGKSALSVHWAHRVRGEFPDGQLHVDLHGYDPERPVDPADALARFLRGLGVPGDDIPFDLEERAARYRTELAGRRVLVLLDNAAGVEQLRPLLPGGPTAAVVVTSRNALAGLVALHGAGRIELDLLPAADAVRLLRRLVGPPAEAEPEAAAALAEQCARLPLALRIAAELAVRRGEALGRLVVELADRQRRIDRLDGIDDTRAQVTAVFSWSVQHLPAAVARTFRLLGLHPGPDLEPYAVAALTDGTVSAAERDLATLAEAHLIYRQGARYGMHDLLRAYAARLAEASEPAGERRTTLLRLYDHYLATAAAAMDAWYPAEAHRRPRVPTADPTSRRTFPTDRDALAWLDAERGGLVAVCEHAASHGRPDHTIALAGTLFRYLQTGGHHTEALAIHDTARRAAQHTGDRSAEGGELANLGGVHARAGRYSRATASFQQALTLFRQTGDRGGQARALNNLGNVHWWLGRYQQAAEHFTPALTLYEQLGDITGQAAALSNLANAHWRQGRYTLAAGLYQRSLDLYRQAGDQAGEAHSHSGLGDVHTRQGRHHEAAEAFNRALELCQRANDRSGEADVHTGLGDLNRRQGRHPTAADHFQRALELYRQAGDRAGEADAHNGLGDTAHAAGDQRRAIEHYTTALALTAQTGDLYQQARAHNGLAHAHQARGEQPESNRHAQHALQLYTTLDITDIPDIAGATDTSAATPCGCK